MARTTQQQTVLPLVGRPLRRAAPLPNGTVKTAVLLPIGVRRAAERFCKEHNVSLTRLVLDALVAYVNPQEESRHADGMKTKLVGRLRHLRKETARINARIEREFEAVEPEEQA
jgi:hypothetical protein